MIYVTEKPIDAVFIPVHVRRVMDARHFKWSPFAKVLDASSAEWHKNRDYMFMFLQAQETYANTLLKSRGHVFLNEVYDMLDLPRTKLGAVMGWSFGYSTIIEFAVSETLDNMYVLDFSPTENLFETVFEDQATPVLSNNGIPYYSNHDRYLEKLPVPQKIIYSYPKTIVLWGDGTKTIVSVSDADIWDEYSGFCAALAKKCYGSTSAGKRVMEKHKVIQKSKKKIVKVPLDLKHPNSFADAINRTLDALKRRYSNE